MSDLGDHDAAISAFTMAGMRNGSVWIEHEGRRLDLHEVDPVANARRKRLPRHPGQRGGEASVPFDPAQVLLDKVTGRRRKGDDK